MIESAELRLEEALAREEALRTAYNELQCDGNYWYRRSMFVEVALKDLSEKAEEYRNTGYEEYLIISLAGADRALAESRKSEQTNFEDFIRDARQKKMLAWCYRAFAGVDDERLHSLKERALRFYEEATELLQAAFAVCTTDSWDRAAMKIINRVDTRPPGDVSKETGQVAVTLNILAEHHGFSLAREEKNEFERVLSIEPSVWAARWQKKIDEGL